MIKLSVMLNEQGKIFILKLFFSDKVKAISERAGSILMREAKPRQMYGSSSEARWCRSITELIKKHIAQYWSQQTTHIMRHLSVLPQKRTACKP